MRRKSGHSLRSSPSTETSAFSSGSHVLPATIISPRKPSGVMTARNSASRDGASLPALSNLMLPVCFILSAGTPMLANLAASSSVGMQMRSKSRHTGSASHRNFCQRRSLRGESRALASTVRIPWARASERRLGQIPPSMSTSVLGRITFSAARAAKRKSSGL